MAKGVSYSIRHFLFLDGTPVILHSFEGGLISADVVQETPRSDSEVNKQLAAIRYEDVIFEAGLNDTIIKVIEKTWNGDTPRLTASLITTDENSKAEYEDTFSDSLVTETVIPQCNITSKDAAFFRLRIKPALIRNIKGDGRVIKSQIKSRQKVMLKSRFKFELEKLPCSRVIAVDSFSVIVNVASNSFSSKRPVDTVTNSINFPNLFLTISMVDFQPWLEWHKKFLIEGNNGKSDELGGRLVFLASDMREKLLAIKLQGVGIFSLQRNIDITGTVFNFRVGLYCERMAIES
jgi:hypothetical protein